MWSLHFLQMKVTNQGQTIPNSPSNEKKQLPVVLAKQIYSSSVLSQQKGNELMLKSNTLYSRLNKLTH